MDHSIRDVSSDWLDNDQEFARPATLAETDAFLDDGEVLRETWMVYDRQFDDGQREICVSRFTRIRQNGPLPLQNRSKRGESDKRAKNQQDSAKRAKQAIRHRCKAIGADRMLTLTYRDNVTDVGLVKIHWDAFRRRMAKLKQFHYVAVLEKQERGAYHIHCAVRGRQVYQLVRSIWQSVVGNSEDGKTGGQINVRDPHKFGFGKTGHHKLASYIAKYVAKDVEDHELNKKRYWSSKGIVVPEKNYYQLPWGTKADEAYAHGLALACAHNNDGLTFFANHALGVFWCATAPVPGRSVAGAGAGRSVEGYPA